MKISYPHTITNSEGEKIIFHGVQKDPDGDKVLVENFVTPGHGPAMHTHFLQDEALTVVSGKLGYLVLGQEERYAHEGETVLFKRGVPHRFWNAGQDILNCQGWIKPANTIVFFLSAIYEAQNKSGKAEPEKFDSAYLLTRYGQEYDIYGIPKFVKKTVMPLTYMVGRMLGKYQHFADAPEPVKA
ncbi:cupin domain-containing protein [Adhaeribacter arboris]|uniref:Cupin domain-containing protein n=1 Tax=Adhaeribacter arboris TaxID=2072846 RepID=A0A2T2YA19_9BACT|nr:cupin domain-containing protein [Adhaeribacter arboris]PSR52370.1 cupin domain-containing protein [Adhaeribacter arboris]